MSDCDEKEGDWFYLGREGGLYPIANVPRAYLEVGINRLAWVEQPAAKTINDLCAYRSWLGGFPESK